MYLQEKVQIAPKRSTPAPFNSHFSPRKRLAPAYLVSHEHIERILRRMSDRGLFGEEQVRDYLLRQLRHNCRPNTIRSSGSTILLFLAFFKRNGGQYLEAIGPEHVSAFVEHEQDRGMAPTSVDGRLKGVYAFLNFLVHRDIIPEDVVKHKLRIRVPDALPRAIDPEDVKQLLAPMEKHRDRALLLTLLRTGMRIGELLSTRVENLNLKEKTIQIIETHKNRVGRVAYLSSDAVEALQQWLQAREYQSEFIFYGQGAGPLCYEAARLVFKNCIEKSDLGHHCIEMTRRYARLTDNTRREAYYKAMDIIEAGEINGHYRFDYQLP
jgi:site-specific recombinase XerD